MVNATRQNMACLWRAHVPFATALWHSRVQTMALNLNNILCLSFWTGSTRKYIEEGRTRFYRQR